jgi:peroxiredoxin/Tfp pilus assembly protein PilF
MYRLIHDKRFSICLTGVLLGLALAGTSWNSPVAQSQEAQGDEAAYNLEYRKGVDLLRRRRYEDALKSFKRANEMRNKQSAECFFGMAQSYMGLEAYKSAAESCDKMVEFAAGNADVLAQAYNLKGTILQIQSESKDQKKLQEAEALFRQGLALGTNHPVIRYNLGFTLMQLNRDAEGIVELKKYLKLVPEGAKAEQTQKLIDNPRRAREAYAPDFSVITSEGEHISLDDLRGKVVVLDFWGAWCEPCVRSVPALRTLNKRYAKEKFVLIGIDTRDAEETWRAFIAKNEMIWPQYRDHNGAIQRAFEIRGFPTYILLDHEGIVRYRSIGTSWEQTGALDDAIKKQLKILAKSLPAE